MKTCHFFLICLAVLFAGCTDLSKVERDDEEEPLEPVPPVVEAPEVEVKVTQQTIKYPFERVIKDLSGRSIEATVLAKLDSKIGFEKVSGMQKFILPLDRLSEEDQTFFNGVYDGGDFEFVSEAISKSARLGNREAIWHRDVDSAEREAEKLDLPRLTLFLIAGDPQSEALEKDLLFSRPFRQWAGQNLVLCAIPVEPFKSKMAITSVMAQNRKVAENYNVTEEATIALNLPGEEDFHRLYLKDSPSVEDVMKGVEGILKKKKKR
ncbi:MAG: hypothetical protein P1U86_10745 [Verrucomicrobiales bacterium]|nr:hypothetical protein [Verrucomicrobiales bacterium]